LRSETEDHEAARLAINGWSNVRERDLIKGGGDHLVDFDQTLWDAEFVQAHPLINTATMIIPHTELLRFLAATGHAPQIISVPAQTAEDVAP
jgi:hypothetical protein